MKDKEAQERRYCECSACFNPDKCDAMRDKMGLVKVEQGCALPVKE
jgi:hypothetical protein